MAEKASISEQAMRLLGVGADIHYALADELAETVELMQSRATPAMERVVIRTLFSILEALAFSLKARALDSARAKEVVFNAKELRFLEEGERVLKDGREVWEHHYLGIKANLRSALKCYAKARKTATPLSGTAPLPPSFDHALELRRRVTHPKSVGELSISTEDLRSASELLTWLARVSDWCQEQEQARIRRVREKIIRSIESQRTALRDGKPWSPDLS